MEANSHFTEIKDIKGIKLYICHHLLTLLSKPVTLQFCFFNETEKKQFKRMC